MIGLMTLWFGPLLDLEAEPGYFHLCPACYRRVVEPHYPEIRDRLARMHPAPVTAGSPEPHPAGGSRASPAPPPTTPGAQGEREPGKAATEPPADPDGDGVRTDHG